MAATRFLIERLSSVDPGPSLALAATLRRVQRNWTQFQRGRARVFLSIMCGIVGVLGVHSDRARPAAERMRVALRHRGPDDEGEEQVARADDGRSIVLGHTRLSIVELTDAGHQPMADDGAPPGVRPNVIVFNGEIYNFREVAEDLARLGLPCRSRSDTEVILKAYRAWGVRAVERLDGMFAFVLVDRARNLAWFCRDRLGIKPLYLFRPAGGGLLFASEVRALLAAGEDLVPRRARPAALESFLSQGAVMGDDSLVEGVSMLPAGTSLVTDLTGQVARSVRYWSAAFGADAGANVRSADGSGEASRAPLPLRPAPYRSEVVTELGLGLRRSMRLLLLADVPVGLFLSSGVDSGVLATVATESRDVRLRTLSIGFDVPGFDELLGARATARDLGTEHVEVTLTGASVLESFDEVLDAVDQPTVDGFNTFHVARAARGADLKVALSGLGGDELFGGYASLRDVPRAFRLSRALHAVTGPRVRHGLSRVAARVGGTVRLDARMLMKLEQTFERPADLLSLYLLRRELFSQADRRALLPLPVGSDPSSGLEEPMLAELRGAADGRHPIDAVAAFELHGYMRDMLLRDSDVFSMAHGLEIRVPLLEPYIVEQAARAQSGWRKPDPRPKPLLLDAAGPRLPERAWREKKRGFTFPWAAWLRGPLRARVEDSLAVDRLSSLGLDQRAAREIWRRFAEGDGRTSALQIIGLLVLDALVRRDGLRV
jgi:asparagine synthase (glutamine-hydrolysing)